MSSEKQLAANASNSLLSTGARTSQGRAKVSRNALKHGLSSRQVLGVANLLPHENAADFEQLRDDLRGNLCPLNAMEEALVERIVSVTWRLRRLGGIEAGLMTYHLWRLMHERASKEEKGINPLATTPARLRIIDDDAPSPTPPLEERLSAGAGRIMARQDRESAEAVLRDEAATQGEAFTRMLGKDALSKLSRYESSLERSLFKALHELQRLQAERRGEPVVPPLVVDVNVTGMEE